LIFLRSWLSRWLTRRNRQFLTERGPFEQRVERRAQCLSPFRQAIFNLGRDLMVDDAPHDSIGLHLTELLNKHLLRNRGDRPLEVREAQQLSIEELKQNEQLPATLKNLEGIFHAFSRRSGRVVGSGLTFRQVPYFLVCS
jgi:hypothetical protein